MSAKSCTLNSSIQFVLQYDLQAFGGGGGRGTQRAVILQRREFLLFHKIFYFNNHLGILFNRH